MQLPKRFSLTSQRFSKDGTVFRTKKKGGIAGTGDGANRNPLGLKLFSKCAVIAQRL
jgi:hypothetical protein